MVQPRIGGSFAPPLDGDKIARYRELAKAAEPPIRDSIVALCAMVETFHETPTSTRPGTPHPVGRGTIVPLEDDEVKRIWNLVPWKHELEAIQKLFEAVQADVAERNTKALGEWDDAIAKRLAAEYFPGMSPDKRRESIALATQIDRASFTDEQKDAMVATLFPGLTMATLWGRCNDLDRNRHSIRVGKVNPPIPKPTLESTELRDACFHLLWYAIELEQDHEPLTSDKL